MIRENLHREAEGLCRALIREKSVSGQEAGAAAVLRKAMERLGFDSVSTDENGSVIGRIFGDRPGPRVLFDGHIDTVPVNDPAVWKHPPFGAEKVEDRIYGRGASDMKGAVAAMIPALAAFKEETGGHFPGEVVAAGVVYEELFEGVACRSISRAVEPDFVVIGESTRLNLKTGQRGRAELVVETAGKPAHSANPEKGVNAVKMMLRFLTRLEEGYVPTEQPGLGKGILELTDIISAPYPGSSVVPEKCTATFDRRLLTGETEESVLAPIQALLEAMHAEDGNFNGKAYFREQTLPCYTGGSITARRFFPAWKFPDDAPFNLAALRALREAGLHPEVTAYSFCTNGSHYAGERGIRTLGFGPSLENLAHTVDEYITLDQLYGAADGYLALCRALTACQ